VIAIWPAAALAEARAKVARVVRRRSVDGAPAASSVAP
jgi:hypothetical protein